MSRNCIFIAVDVTRDMMHFLAPFVIRSIDQLGRHTRWTTKYGNYESRNGVFSPGSRRVSRGETGHFQVLGSGRRVRKGLAGRAAPYQSASPVAFWKTKSRPRRFIMPSLRWNFHLARLRVIWGRANRMPVSSLAQHSTGIRTDLGLRIPPRPHCKGQRIVFWRHKSGMLHESTTKCVFQQPQLDQFN